MGPIRFRIGFREYLIGYLSYIRPSSSRYSVSTIIYLTSASCLLTIALLTFAICLYFKLKRSNEKMSSLSQNTLTRAPLLVCPYHQHYKQDYSTLSLIQQFQSNSPFLTTLSIEHEQLKKLIYTSDIK
jgi:hypothetical protein